MTDRITYTYLGGPLDGRIAHYAKKPLDLSVPFLNRLTFSDKPKEENTPLLTAAGMYHIEERQTPDEMLPKGTPPWTYHVAVHHPSDADEDWHPLEKKAPEPVKAVERPKRDRPVRVIDADTHPIGRQFLPMMRAMKASSMSVSIQKKDEPDPDLH